MLVATEAKPLLPKPSPKNKIDKIRLDQLVASLGLAESGSQAQALIMAGRVLVDDTPMTKPGHQVPGDAKLRVKGKQHRFVGRGGVKLAHALQHFGQHFGKHFQQDSGQDSGFSPRDCTALDIGSSTGGFTDVLLKEGAKQVIAVDVGHGQLDWRLRQDKRVVVLERTNARYLTADMIGDRLVDWVVCDVSFISLKKVLPAALALVREGGWLVALIKPQFEVGKGQVGKGGVVRDAKLQAEVVADMEKWLADHDGGAWQVKGVVESPITGADGNREFFIAGVKKRAG